MKRKGIVTAGLAVALVLGAAVAPATAYLTGNDEALGRVSVGPLADQVYIEEDVEGLKKTVTLTADPKSGPVYVRMRAYTGSEHEQYLRYVPDDEGLWVGPDDEGWYNYAAILGPGESANGLVVELDGLPEGMLLTEGDSVNVVIVYEYTPVLFDEDGEPYADWSDELSELIVEEGEA